MFAIECGLFLSIAVLLVRQRRWQIDFVVAVEEREELVIVALRERVVLVVVTLGAAESRSEEDLGGRVDAIDDGLDAELFLVHAAFLVRQRIAVEAGSGLLLECRAG